MSTCDDVSSRSNRTLFRLLKNYRASLLSLLSILLLAGCYAFVDDKTPPEWDGAADAQQNAADVAAAGGPGAAVFNAKCAVCHQTNGKGIPGVYPPLSGSAIATGDPHRPIKIVLHGFHGPIERDGKKYNGVMQPWKDVLSNQEIADVLTFVRSSWGNSAPEVSPETVKEVREATKSKSGAFTEDEL